MMKIINFLHRFAYFFRDSPRFWKIYNKLLFFGDNKYNHLLSFSLFVFFFISIKVFHELSPDKY